MQANTAAVSRGCFCIVVSLQVTVGKKIERFSVLWILAAVVGKTEV